MKKTFRYRAKINKQTEANANQWIELCRKLYNQCLEERIKIYEETEETISGYEQMENLVSLKREHSEYKQVGSQALQDVIQRLDKAYQSFFRRVKNEETPGFPRFKGKDRYHSFTLKKAGWKIDGRYLSIRNIGVFKLFLSRPVEGTIKTITIKRSSTNKWFVLFSCDDVSDRPLPKTNKEIAIDVGCEKFLETSNNEKIENPRFSNKSTECLIKRQQSLSRKKKGSTRRRKARLLVAKIHEKINNQRKDFHFKTANWLVKNFDIIYIEEMKSWNTTTALNRSMRDVAWFSFFSILTFKAEEAGKEVFKVPAKGTSQICSSCGIEVPKDLSIRVHNCPNCGLSIDRDLNAALNILRLGQSLRLHTSPRISRL